jgi:ferredoxin-NADP reductase
MSILRTILDLQLDLPVTLLYGCRTRDDVIFARELEALRLRLANFRLVLTLSAPDASWNGSAGRVGPALLHRHVPEPGIARYFLCGPGAFTETLSAWLREHAVPVDRIHSEQFGKPRKVGSPEAIPAWHSGVEPAPVAG